MSVLFASGANNGLTATTNLSNAQSFTKLFWAKMSAGPTGFTGLLSTVNSGVTAYATLYAGTGVADLAVESSSQNLAFGSQPTFTDWTCYALTGTTAGANSLIGYWQDNAGGGFVSKSCTGTTITVSNDNILNNGTLPVSITAAYYMEWNVVLTPTQLQAQFLSASAVITGASLRRYLALSNAASAGTDTSGNSFNMTAVGTLADGTGLPTFPNLVPQLLLLGAG